MVLDDHGFSSLPGHQVHAPGAGSWVPWRSAKVTSCNLRCKGGGGGFDGKCLVGWGCGGEGSEDRG